MPTMMPKAVAGIKIPDSTIARQATELLLEHGSAADISSNLLNNYYEKI